MAQVDAFHLPGLESGPGAGPVEWEIREYDGGAVRLRLPRLDPVRLGSIVAELKASRARYLASRPLTEIVSAIDQAAARLQDREDPRRRLAEELLPHLTGYSRPMVSMVLDRMTADWRAPALEALVEAEFGVPHPLDEFVALPRGLGGAGPLRYVRAYGPELTFHLFAGNVPGVAVTSLIRALLVKSASVGKMASGEPLLAPLFAQTLAEIDPELGSTIGVTYWPGGSTELEAVVLEGAETTVVYGGAEVVESIRRRLPSGRKLIEHGPRLSLALIGREVLSGQRAQHLASDLALAVATFDQQGCVSPHLAYVEVGGEVSPEGFAELVAAELARIEAELPRGKLSPEEAAAIQRERGAAEFGEIGGRGVRLWASRGTEYTLIYDEDPTFTASCLNRLIRIVPLNDLGEVIGYMSPYRVYLQTIGLEASADRRLELAGELGRLGVSRVTSLEAMPWPPPEWHHDGAGPLRELVRWVDLE